jgi:glycosyltransferase involved in cell wall biosynthesis
MSTRPCLSIIIPTYNRASIVPKAVASALKGCPPHAEVIVVDDRSNTAKTALASMAGDPRLKVVTNEGEKGAAGARNYGVARARGDVILFLDDDDELVPDYPARVLVAANQSKADFGFCAANLVDHQKKTEKSSISTGGAPLRQGILQDDVPLRDKMPGLSYGVWIRKSIFQDVGGICTKQIVDEDGDLFCRLYGRGHACWFEAEPGVRIHKAYEAGGQKSSQLTLSTDPKLEAECRLRTYAQNHHYFPRRSAEHWFLIRRVLRFAARVHVDDVAVKFIAEIRPIDWRIRGWIFWKIKKMSTYRRQK